ncbi:glycosyltransferase [Jeotgalibacillus sp. S-D1]|uniref:glycosyltransferase n=1 Tax=Jeotgalibacillus sp. S-D1 TaxID=2552189 RepID=UPI001059318F|nr:glycosyltransferase [Jeotgalibacillus sp. S-D1]TDL31812.1 glycosyltransferase [Jeotgalibacillus sp. S-D1]
MKQKIIFMVINMNVGGTEKALLNMLEELPEEQFDVTVFMLEKYGGFLESLPKRVQIDYLTEYKELRNFINLPPKSNALKIIKEGKLINGLSFSIIYLVSKITKNKSLFYKYLLRNVSVLKKEYDIAVAYAGPMDFISYFVSHKIKAKKKVQWIHFDVTKIGIDSKFMNDIYKKFNTVFTVSHGAKEKIIQLIPSLKGKTEVFHNIVLPTEILNLSKEHKGFSDNFEGIRILTVGRLNEEKGQDLAIKAMAKLIQEGFNIKWYCIGEGSSRKKYERLIADNNLQDHFILLGSNPNPYPYMAQCDIYVQPSRHEGYCITLTEAKILRKPIVTTNFIGSDEQIVSGKTGLITEPDEEKLYFAIKKMLNNSKIGTYFSDNLSSSSFKKVNEMQRLIR